MKTLGPAARVFLAAGGLLMLSACASEPEGSYQGNLPASTRTAANEQSGTANDATATDAPDAAKAKKVSTPAVGNGIGVNGYLWRASLDTLAFMPLTSADPWGGVIITDWYANPNVPDERFKMTVYILDQKLRADGVKVTVFRQVKNGNQWTDAPTNPTTGYQIENSILTRARQLRVDTTPQ